MKSAATVARLKIESGFGRRQRERFELGCTGAGRRYGVFVVPRGLERLRWNCGKKQKEV